MGLQVFQCGPPMNISKESHHQQTSDVKYKINIRKLSPGYIAGYCTSFTYLLCSLHILIIAHLIYFGLGKTIIFIVFDSVLTYFSS